ncbi:type II toxin-antitoxin system VapC family toxin [soil metagenome]
MIAIDTNLLVYAHRREAPLHSPANRVVAEAAQGRRPWGIPWPCIHEFLAIVTHARIYDPPSTLQQAVAQIEAWMASPTLHLLGEATTHWPNLRDLLATGEVNGPMVHDARVAAICLGHHISELWTLDRDFSRFPGLPSRNPL